MSRTAPPGRQAAHAEPEAFDRAFAPYFPELLQAAQREVRHYLTLGQFEPDNPTPEQLLDMARVARASAFARRARHQSLGAGLHIPHCRSVGGARV